MPSNIYVAPFYRPPTTSTAYPSNLQPGQIVLYKDDDWSSTSLTINIYDSAHPEGYPFSFTGTPLQDDATWIAFCLPAGTVCTLFDNTIAAPSPNPGNFAGAGVCVDLIGDGTTRTVDLNAYGANDCLSAGIWRVVDMSEGWFQLLSHSDFSGPLNTIFLDEWPTASFNSLSGWWMDNSASAVNYPCLTPPQTLLLNANTDGSGQQIALGASNPFGETSTPATVNLADSGMNNKITSFAVTLIPAVKAVVASVTTPPIIVPIPAGQTLIDSVTGTNNTTAPVLITCQVGQSQTYSVQNTVSLQYTTSLTVTASVTVSEGIKDVESTSATITTSFTVASQSTTTNSTTTTNTFQLGQTIVFQVPALTGTTYRATASVSFGTLPLTSVTTSGSFYYRQRLPGAVQDPAGSGLWLLTMPVVVNLSGAVGTQVSFSTSIDPPADGESE